MRFGDDFERKIAGAAREGAEKLIIEHARAVKAQMGSEGTGIAFHYVKGSGSALDNLGSLKVNGPSDAVVQKFHKLLRERMGQ
jgi:hypothetical protein